MGKVWIPKYIQKSMGYRANDIVTASDYNAILNLLITQGDYNTEWLEWLTNEGFAEFFKDLNGEDIKQLVVQAAGEQLASLASTSANKTSAHLDSPVFTFLDESPTTSAVSVFKNTLDSYGISGTVSCYSSLVNSGTPYMTLNDLLGLQADGYAVINHGATREEITVDTVDSVAVAKKFMQDNGLSDGANIFAYTNTDIPSEEICRAIAELASEAIGNDLGTNDTDIYDIDWLQVIPMSASEEVIAQAIEDTIKYNRWCIFKCDTSSADFDVAVLNSVVDRVAAQATATITTVPTAANLSAHTLNNRIKSLNLEMNALRFRVENIEKLLQGYKNITYGHVSEGLPVSGNEGDIHIMYE